MNIMPITEYAFVDLDKECGRCGAKIDNHEFGADFVGELLFFGFLCSDKRHQFCGTEWRDPRNAVGEEAE